MPKVVECVTEQEILIRDKKNEKEKRIADEFYITEK